jgi:hypothetical protein
MELIQYKVDASKLNGKPIAIMPIGDIQWAGPKGSTSLDLLRRRIDVGLKHDAWFLGMGDYIDFMSPSNRKARKGAGFYDTTEMVIDDKAMELTQEIFEKALKPTVGRWYGLLEGHHFTQLEDGTTTDQHLARWLKTAFLGTTVGIGLKVENFQGSSASCNVDIWATHGCGGGTTAAAPVNKLEKVSPSWHVDLMVMGHMTKKAHAEIDRVEYYWGKKQHFLRHRTMHLVGAGGFSKGYMERTQNGKVPRGSYVEAGMMRPVVLGNPLVFITPNIYDKVKEGERVRYWSPQIEVLS